MEGRARSRRNIRIDTTGEVPFRILTGYHTSGFKVELNGLGPQFAFAPPENSSFGKCGKHCGKHLGLRETRRLSNALSMLQPAALRPLQALAAASLPEARATFESPGALGSC